MELEVFMRKHSYMKEKLNETLKRLRDKIIENNISPEKMHSNKKL
jgi:hypothetical protein